MSFASATFNVSPNAGDNGSSVLPIGSIINFGGSTAPPSWLICDGTAVSRNTYTSLFGVIGTTYGAGDGTAVPIFSGAVGGGAGLGYTLNFVSNPYIVVGTTFMVNGTGTALDGNTYTAIDPTSSTLITFIGPNVGLINTGGNGTITKMGTLTTFNVPNTAGRMVRGVGTASWTGLGGGTASTTIVALGGSGGADGTKVSADNLPQHRHGFNIAAGSGYTATNGVNGNRADQTANYTTQAKTYTDANDGGGAPILATNSNAPTLNAYVGINYIIKFS